jgi:hypothetical protein
MLIPSHFISCWPSPHTGNSQADYITRQTLAKAVTRRIQQRLYAPLVPLLKLKELRQQNIAFAFRHLRALTGDHKI